MRNKEARRKEHYERATGKPYSEANKEKGRLYEQVKKFSPNLLVEKQTIKISHEQRMEFLKYPAYWRPTIEKGLLAGETFDSIIEELKNIENTL